MNIFQLSVNFMLIGWCDPNTSVYEIYLFKCNSIKRSQLGGQIDQIFKTYGKKIEAPAAVNTDERL